MECRKVQLGKHLHEPHPGSGREVLWMKDFDNHLGILSLSTHKEVPTEHVDEMVLKESPRGKVMKPVHEPVGS